jgi:calcium/calmodulin-dependent protein kinase I
MMRGKEYMILNEIKILKKVSKGHKNIITLHDCKYIGQYWSLH